MKNLKATQASLLREKYNHVKYKERPPNQGDTTQAKKVEKRSSLGNREE